MKRLVKNILLAALAGSLLAGPLQAQSQRDGYKFLEAVKKRQGDEATLLLEEPGSVLVNSRDISSGETALHIVTQRRDAVWLRFLLSKGANPNLADKHGTTPLQLAAQLGFCCLERRRFHVGDHDLHSFAQKRLGQRLSNTAGPTRDDGNPSL